MNLRSQDERNARRLGNPEIYGINPGSVYRVLDSEGKPEVMGGCQSANYMCIRVHSVEWIPDWHDRTTGHPHIFRIKCDRVVPFIMREKSFSGPMTIYLPSLGQLELVPESNNFYSSAEDKVHVQDISEQYPPIIGYLDNEESVARAIEILDRYGVIIIDFGPTWGIVFKPEQRMLAANLRGEFIGALLTEEVATSSLVATKSYVHRLIGGNDHGGIADQLHTLTELLTNVGFVRLPRNLYEDNIAENAKSYFTKSWYVNKKGEIQIFPLSNHPFLDAWEKAHPEQPILGVRSLNITGLQEEPLSKGAHSFAQGAGIPGMYYLSSTHAEIQEKDYEALYQANKIKTDERGFTTGSYDPEYTVRQAMGSVVITGIDSDGVFVEKDKIINGSVLVYPPLQENEQSSVRLDIAVHRLGNLSPRTIIMLLKKMHELYGLRIGVMLESGKSYRTSFETKEEDWLMVWSSIVTAAMLSVADEPQIPELTSSPPR